MEQICHAIYMQQVSFMAGVKYNAIYDRYNCSFCIMDH